MTDAHSPLTIPIFPPEITDSIIWQLDSDPAFLATCGLVARAWLPASRYRFYKALRICGDDIPGLLGLIESPTNTILGALRELEVSLMENGPMDSFLHRLPEFIRLRKVTILNSILGEQFSTVSSISSVALDCVYLPSFRMFTDLLRRFPMLKHLKLGIVGWGDRIDQTADDAAPGPPLVLDTFYFRTSSDPAFLHWLGSVETSPMTRSLELNNDYRSPTITSEVTTTDGISRYFRRQNVHLEHLHFKSAVRPLFATSVDLSTNTALQFLHIDCAVSFDVDDELDWELRIPVAVLQLLRRLTSHSLRVLSLQVLLDLRLNANQYGSVQGLAAVLNGPCYAHLQRLEFRNTWNSESRAAFVSGLVDELPEHIAKAAVLVSDAGASPVAE
ncbi:hypothetical protein C8R43DRAFT_1308 [Mycena crocata]|nr:hypothetical protein C8R43DRAFT_1308 [Mycena crocata]